MLLLHDTSCILLFYILCGIHLRSILKLSSEYCKSIICVNIMNVNEFFNKAHIFCGILDVEFCVVTLWIG